MIGQRTRISLLFWVGCCLCLSAQTVQITSIGLDGTLAWTQSLTNGTATVEWTTNLAAGPWLPVKNIFASNAICVAQPPPGQPLPGFYRVLEADLSLVPVAMALVPAGYFQMGDPYSEAAGFTYDQPVHDVFVGGFYVDDLDVSNEQMAQALQWALGQGLIVAGMAGVTNQEGQAEELLSLNGNDHGYPYTQIAFSNGLFLVSNEFEDFPATGVTWYGALAYCNYRSDMEGLPRCVNFTNWTCNFTQTGYRLPTEAEWEKAARGGMTGQHFPWESYGGSYTNFINPDLANYVDQRTPYYSMGIYTTPVGYFNGNQIYRGLPDGTNMVNGYGLYDMAGNVWQWCWDDWQANWYSQPGATQPNPTGPVGLVTRVIRGGSYGYTASYLVCACRHTEGWAPTYASEVVGFRCVRRPP